MPTYTPNLSPEQYLESERAAEFRHEYINGVMSAMAHESWNHAMISGDVLGSLGAQLRGRSCTVATSNFRLCVSRELYTYADVMVICGKPQLVDRHMDMVTDATLIVAVLSPSTETMMAASSSNSTQPQLPESGLPQELR